jgi:hypothetical protein
MASTKTAGHEAHRVRAKRVRGKRIERGREGGTVLIYSRVLFRLIPMEFVYTLRASEHGNKVTSIICESLHAEKGEEEDFL